MIIDFHTHVFPPAVRENRDDYIRQDPTFAEMYRDPKAKIATAPELLESMERSAVDHCVVQTFAWRDAETLREHNDYLLEVAQRSRGRLIPFVNVNLRHPEALREIERCAAAGARGLGELRPDSQGWDVVGEAGDQLGIAARTHGLILLFHVTERGGHAYKGKDGLALVRFHAFTRQYPDLRIVGAHMGGGIYTDYADLEPESDMPDVYVDTAAQPFLYPRDRDVAALTTPPSNRVLFGSDFPLITQERQLTELRAVYEDADALDEVLGRNAARLLGMPH
jgi:predicted TIM-barrel fold metal-dependent hydrolase